MVLLSFIVALLQSLSFSAFSSLSFLALFQTFFGFGRRKEYVFILIVRAQAFFSCYGAIAFIVLDFIVCSMTVKTNKASELIEH